MQPIISVRNLSKKYIIGENIHGRGARTFRDIFDYKTKRLFRRGIKRNKEDTTIWALKDVSLDVDQGEVVGIIGRNGAGKSTLLKILSRITEPTEGDVTLRGRVASLLEVGTGFNQELTGRENIFLNGSILGMKKKEIKDKFDEIVAFAEVEKFIDTPVKRYSSGMYVRLAFAVAAHLEPEILIVDEVLAVGDAEFQKKCLGKMGEVGKQGRTVLFVSHNMPAMRQLVKRCILLQKGRIENQGSTDEVVEAYIRSVYVNQAGEVRFEKDPTKHAQILRLAIRNHQSEISHIVSPDYPFVVEVDFEVRSTREQMHVAFMLELPEGIMVLNAMTFTAANMPKTWPIGTYRVRMEVPPETINAGRFVVRAGIGCMNGEVLDAPHASGQGGLTFELSSVSKVGSAGLGYRRRGILALEPQFTHSSLR